MYNSLLLSLSGGGEWVIILIFLVIILTPTVFLPIYVLLDILRSEFRKDNDKIIWLLVVFFIPILGCVLYFLIGRNQKIIP